LLIIFWVEWDRWVRLLEMVCLVSIVLGVVIVILLANIGSSHNHHKIGNPINGKSVSISGNGKHLAIGALNAKDTAGKVTIYKRLNAHWILLQTISPGLDTDSMCGSTITFNKNGTLLFIGCSNKQIFVYHGRESRWEQSSNFSVFDSQTYSVSKLYYNGTTLVVGGSYDGMSGTQMYQVSSTEPKFAYSFSEIGYRVAMGGSRIVIAYNGKLKIYTGCTQTFSRTIEESSISALAMSGNGNYLAVGLASSSILMFQSFDNFQLQTTLTPSQEVRTMEFNYDGSILVVQRNSNVCILRRQDGVATFHSFGPCIASTSSVVLPLSTDGTLLVMGDGQTCSITTDGRLVAACFALQPTSQPTSGTTSQPFALSTAQPSAQPSSQPTSRPSKQPSQQPTRQPSQQPSSRPTDQPVSSPTAQPNSKPAHHPTTQPSSMPTSTPSINPTESSPSCQPSSYPTNQPTGQPSFAPSSHPTNQPSAVPSQQPTIQSSVQPSVQPSASPTSIPSNVPSCQPSIDPTNHPSTVPSAQPSNKPSSQPSSIPSTQPSDTPSAQPSWHPTSVPTRVPTVQPTLQPSREPVAAPSRCPSNHPTSQPSAQPLSDSSSLPIGHPTCIPSCLPSSQPSRQPTRQPTW
jgi:hypothetical protein